MWIGEQVEWSTGQAAYKLLTVHLSLGHSRALCDGFLLLKKQEETVTVHKLASILAPLWYRNASIVLWGTRGGQEGLTGEKLNGNQSSGEDSGMIQTLTLSRGAYARLWSFWQTLKQVSASCRGLSPAPHNALPQGPHSKLFSHSSFSPSFPFSSFCCCCYDGVCTFRGNGHS